MFWNTISYLKLFFLVSRMGSQTGQRGDAGRPFEDDWRVWKNWHLRGPRHEFSWTATVINNLIPFTLIVCDRSTLEWKLAQDGWFFYMLLFTLYKQVHPLPVRKYFLCKWVCVEILLLSLECKLYFQCFNKSFTWKFQIFTSSLLGILVRDK